MIVLVSGTVHDKHFLSLFSISSFDENSFPIDHTGGILTRGGLHYASMCGACVYALLQPHNGMAYNNHSLNQPITSQHYLPSLTAISISCKSSSFRMEFKKPSVWFISDDVFCAGGNEGKKDFRLLFRNHGRKGICQSKREESGANHAAANRGHANNA